MSVIFAPKDLITHKTYGDGTVFSMWTRDGWYLCMFADGYHTVNAKELKKREEKKEDGKAV